MQSRIILFVCFILISCLCSGQSKTGKISRGGIGFSVTPFGTNKVYEGPEDEEYGRGIYTFSKAPFYAGQLYGFFTIKKTQVVIGLGHSWNEISAVENFEGDNYYYRDAIKVFSIPIYMRKTFFNYVYITYGAVVNIEYDHVYNRHTRIDEQSGVGLISSLGGTYHFKSGINVFAGPSVYLYEVFGPYIIFNDKVAGIGAEFGMSIDL